MTATDRRAQLVRRIDALLPQTQCTKCGYAGCAPYAEALADGLSEPNRCPPGGAAGAVALASLLEVTPLPLDTTRGQPGPLTVAVIDEQHCIGCTLCIRACPVDAILGANKRMHTVLADVCTGCDLCVAPCPVDCISMQPVQPARAWSGRDANLARARHQARQRRLARQADSPGAAPAAAASPATSDAQSAQEAKRAAIAAAIARARARRQS